MLFENGSRALVRNKGVAEGDISCRLVIVDSDESWSKGLAAEGIIAKFIALDFSDEATVYDKCSKVIKDVEKVRCPSSLSLQASILLVPMVQMAKQSQIRL